MVRHGTKNEVLTSHAPNHSNTDQITMAEVVTEHPVRRPPSVWIALLIAAVSGVVATIATVLVLENSYGTGVEALLAGLALLAFGATVYGLIQAVLAVIDTAGERRRQDRDVSERRQGERARKPKDT